MDPDPHYGSPPEYPDPGDKNRLKILSKKCRELKIKFLFVYINLRYTVFFQNYTGICGKLIKQSKIMLTLVYNIFLSGRIFTPWIRIRMEAEADAGLGSTLQHIHFKEHF